MSDNLDLDAQQTQPNIDPQLGIYAIYIKKLEDLQMELSRKLMNSEVNNEILQNSLNQANDAYSKLMEQFQQLGQGMHITTQQRDELNEEIKKYQAKEAEFKAMKLERDSTCRQRDDYHRELQIQINRANELEHRIAIVEQNARNAIDRANAAELEASKAAGELKALKVKPDPLDLDAKVKQPKKKVAKVK